MNRFRNRSDLRRFTVPRLMPTFMAFRVRVLPANAAVVPPSPRYVSLLLGGYVALVDIDSSLAKPRNGPGYLGR